MSEATELNPTIADLRRAEEWERNVAGSPLMRLAGPKDIYLAGILGERERIAKWFDDQADAAPTVPLARALRTAAEMVKRGPQS